MSPRGTTWVIKLKLIENWLTCCSVSLAKNEIGVLADRTGGARPRSRWRLRTRFGRPGPRWRRCRPSGEPWTWTSTTTWTCRRTTL
jgi:hypothetical protein